MTTDAIIAELRSLPGAPDGLRERVRELREPEPRFRFELPTRRVLLVAVPAVVVVALGAAAVHGLLNGSPQTVAQPTVVRGEAAPVAAAHGQSLQRFQKRAAASGTTLDSEFRAAVLAPSQTRLNRYQAWLRVKVGQDELGDAARRAMQIARNAGGYVASVDMNTPGKTGVASLVLRVPNTKVQGVVMQLEKLGAVSAQHIRIADLTRTADQQERSILELQKTIARLKQRLADPNLSPEQRLELQYELTNAKRQLAQLTKRHANTVREGTLATVSATFFVPQEQKKAHHESRLGRTFHSAGGFLVRELAWLLFALIVFGPIALLAFGLVVAFRAARRRSDARLLEGT
jgi:hypothetical protein